MFFQTLPVFRLIISWHLSACKLKLRGPCMQGYRVNSGKSPCMHGPHSGNHEMGILHTSHFKNTDLQNF